MYKLLLLLCHYGAFAFAWVGVTQLDLAGSLTSADYVLILLTLAFTAQMLSVLVSRNEPPKPPTESPLTPIPEGT
jgi:hypothetical protein